MVKEQGEAKNECNLMEDFRKEFLCQESAGRI